MTSPTKTDATIVYAAGALVWRERKHRIETLVIHRSGHGDYSLPKGKVDAGETLPETAAREIWEETGLEVSLGAPLGTIEYTLPSGRPKEVHYWTCEVPKAVWKAFEFEPNDEVDRVEWLPLDEAVQTLSYDRDRDLVRRFAERVEAGAARTFPLVLLRHAKAVPGHSWSGDDESRPLTARGQAQAAQIVPLLRAYAPERIVTSTAVRCRATVAPLADALAVTPASERLLSQSVAPLDGELRYVLEEALADRESTLVCSHSPVLPELARALAQIVDAKPKKLSRNALLSTAEASVFHLSAGEDLGVVAVETHGPII
ncbi:NUDIX domain-containing protein [Gulosibacter sp. 10]|uniref:NUDIX hydrolase n=1 Tax=Gulosibacter sp. 10 TaxID=1255570 RepID=UPI00097F1D2F|nr:NUDIX domain-containing protein [Gulosibacter sp. 10]SJM71638.1 MutT1 [Gulosibacter sp. 10]